MCNFKFHTQKMSPRVVVTCSDPKGSTLLKDGFREQSMKFKLDALLTYLKEIEQSNPNFAVVDFQEKQKTTLFTCDHYLIPKLNERSVMSFPGMDPEKPLKPYVSLRTYNSDNQIREMMEKIQRLCITIGELRYFHYETVFNCHVGGFEYNVNAMGVDGVFIGI